MPTILNIMVGERTERGLEARLRPRGVARYFSAAFLLVWLTGWAIGECVALWALVHGAISVITGQPFDSKHAAIALGPALFGGAFLLIWLAFWTLGGVAAILALLRSLWAEDRMIAGAGELSVEHRVGPFSSRRTIPQSDVKDIRLLPHTSKMVAETVKGRIELSTLGAPGERQELAALLKQEMSLDSQSSNGPAGALPAGWQDVITPEGTHALVQDPALRASRARAVAVIAFVFAGATTAMIWQAISRPSAIPGAIFVAALSVGCAWAATWLARGRMEWRFESGRLVLQRRFGATVSERFEATRLDLTVTHDSDGDETFRLVALAGADAMTTATGGTNAYAPAIVGAGESAPAIVGAGAYARVSVGPGSARPISGPALRELMTGDNQHRRTICSALNDDAVPRQLGLWLSQAARVPLEDHSSEKGKVIELAQLREQLANSGKLGKLASRFIEQVERSQSR